MTIQGWVFFGILALFILSFGIFGAIIFEKIVWKVLSVVAAMLLIIGLFAGMRWYYQNTASGQRAMTDQKSELDNGLERTVTIYTADGEIIAQYTGKIDIEGNDGGYVLFDYEGKRYTYYNCFVAVSYTHLILVRRSGRVHLRRHRTVLPMRRQCCVGGFAGFHGHGL